MPIKEKVWEPLFNGRDSNSSNWLIAINDLDLYNLIWLLFDKTSTKYEPSIKPGIKLFSAVYVISSPVIKLTFDENEITLYFKVLGSYPCKSILAVALEIVDWTKDFVISYEGNEFDATYMLSSKLL